MDALDGVLLFQIAVLVGQTIVDVDKVIAEFRRQFLHLGVDQSQIFLVAHLEHKGGVEWPIRHVIVDRVVSHHVDFRVGKLLLALGQDRAVVV